MGAWLHLRLVRVPLGLRFAIVFVAALLQATGASWPFSFWFVPGAPLWWLQCIGLVALAAVLRSSPTQKQAGAIAWLFATIWLCATFWWLFVSLHTYGGLPTAFAVLAIVSLAGALGGYYALACMFYWRLRNRSPMVSSLAFAALWTMAEMARGTWFTGFGWGAIGYAHADGPLALWIPWFGVYGLGALAAWLAAALVVTPASGWGQRGAVVLVLMLGFFGGNAMPVWSNPAGTLSVTLLQGNIPQDEKFESGSGIPLALAWYAEQLQKSATDLVVAPETAIPVLPESLPDGYWDALVARFSPPGQAALVGAPLGDMAAGYTNSVVALVPQQALRAQELRYDKHHLVPFGEFIPPLFKWFTRMMNIPLGDFNRGAVGQASVVFKGQRLAPNICYEDLFGEELGARFADPPTSPTIFVNVSNIGWFGDTVAIDQHLQISRIRALEFERPMLRATNTGATAIIDHAGRVTHSLPRSTRGALVGEVQGRVGTTPFAWWVARWGLWPLWLACIAMILIASRARPTGADS